MKASTKHEVRFMHQIDKQEFGRFVSQLRKEKGLTQKELASILEISDKAISKWETGVSIPDVGMLIPLSETLGVTVTELLQCQRNPSPEPMESEAVEDLLKTAIAYSDEDQKLNRPDWKQELPKFLLYAIGSGVSTLAVAAMAALCTFSKSQSGRPYAIFPSIVSENRKIQGYTSPITTQLRTPACRI